MNNPAKQTKFQDPNAKLSFIERLSYGIGDYAGNLVYSAISAFLLVYYTEVLGVTAATAGSIMAISKLFDGVSDLIMGRIVDKTHSKWGKARPWIIRMSIPLAVCTVLMFSVPSSLAGPAQVGYMFISYNLVSTVFYTGLNVPYATMQGLMTTNQYERGLLGNFRMLLATFGTMTINTVVRPMCTFFGGGEFESQMGWTITFIILMIVFLVLNFCTFLGCKERVVQETSSEDGQAVKGPSVIECLKSLVVNKYWILVVIQMFAMYFMMSTFFGGNYYFSQYVVGNADSYTVLSNTLSMAQMGFMFVTPFIMRKVSKRWLGFFGLGLSGIGFILTFFAGANVNLIVACNLLKGIGFGCGGATMFGILQDTITYGQWKTNVAAAGMGNAASSFCMKIGSGIGTSALGWILSAGGFDVDPFAAGSIAAIKVACIWVPVVVCVIGMVCLFLLDLDKYYDRVVADLAAGRWKGSSEE